MRKILLLAALVLTFATSAMAGTTLESVKRLSQDTKAFKIYFPSKREAPDVFKVVAELPKLQELTIHMNSVSQEWFAPLAKNTTIKKLRFLGSMGIRYSGLTYVTTMTQLTSYRDNAE